MNLVSRHRRVAVVTLSLCLWLPLGGAQAAVGEAEAAKLGRELTPVGAIAAGNAEGTITPWVGAKHYGDWIRHQTPATLDAMRSGFAAVRKSHPGDFDAMLKAVRDLAPGSAAIGERTKAIVARLPESQRTLAGNLVREMGALDAPQFVITRDNYQQYAAKLTEGHKALFAKYPTYRMFVYPTLRSGFYLPEIEQATRRNATRAKLVGTDELLDAELGYPFPIPGNGAEVIWNHKLRYRASAVRRYNNQSVVKPDGSYQLYKLIEDIKFKYNNIAERNVGTPIIFYYLSEVISPPRVAGQMLLVHETTGIEGRTRDAWLFNPGLGRVNRAPEAGYDTPATGTDGEQLTDQIDMFNGALDRYSWKLLGRREMFIPYNSHSMVSPTFQYKDMIRPRHLNQNLARYELHRVWVVEATLRPGLRHQLKKRVFYLDEDSWSMAVIDGYDSRDQLWKVQEAQLVSLPFVPTVTGVPEAIYDLQSGRYFLTTLVNEDRYQDWAIGYKDEFFFSPAALNKRSRGK